MTEYIYPDGVEPPIIDDQIDDLVARPALDAEFGLDIICDWGCWWGPRYEVEYSTIVTVLDVSDRTLPRVIQKTSMEGHT